MKMFKFLLVYKNKGPFISSTTLSGTALIRLLIHWLKEKKQTPALCNMMDDSREQNEASTLMELQSGRRNNHQEDN